MPGVIGRDREGFVHEDRLARVDCDAGKIEVQSTVPRDDKNEIAVGNGLFGTRRDVWYRYLLGYLTSTLVVLTPNGMDGRIAVCPVVGVTFDVQDFRESLGMTIVRAENRDLCRHSLFQSCVC